jgi:hypothetical protein
VQVHLSGLFSNKLLSDWFCVLEPVKILLLMSLSFVLGECHVNTQHCSLEDYWISLGITDWMGCWIVERDIHIFKKQSWLLWSKWGKVRELLCSLASLKDLVAGT